MGTLKLQTFADDIEEDPIVTVNLKMPSKMRDNFKTASKKNGGTMQSVMFLLAQGYIENADHLRFRLVDARSAHDG